MSRAILALGVGFTLGAGAVFYAFVTEKLIVSYNEDGGLTIQSRKPQPDVV